MALYRIFDLLNLDLEGRPSRPQWWGGRPCLINHRARINEGGGEESVSKLLAGVI